MVHAFSSTLQVATRNVSRHRRRSAITLLAMFVALFLMVLVRSMLNAMNDSTRDGIVEGFTGAVQVHRAGFLRNVQASPLALDLPADDAFLSKIRAVPHVRAVAPRIPFGGLVNAHDRTVFALFVAVDPVEESRVCKDRFAQLLEGVPMDATTGPGSTFTQALLQRLGARPGERAALLASDQDGVLNGVDVVATGVMEDAGMLAADQKMVFLPLKLAQELLRMPGRATELAIAVDDLEHLEDVATTLRTMLGPTYEVSTYKELTPFVEEIMGKQDVLGTFIANIFLFLALLGIANTMLMGVRERTREIGTMMAFGTRRRQVLALFLSEAVLLGALGGVLGAVVGSVLVHYLGASGVPFRATGGALTFELHPYVTTAYVLQTLLTAVLGAALAALYPALRASRLNPIQALSQAV